MNNRKESGFTLVEIAIVLVIISMIVASIMVGQSLVRSSTIRSTINQIQSIQSGISAFMSKYNAIPGDMYYLTASSYNLSAYSSGGPGRGDGDGLLKSEGGTDGYKQTGETVLLWLQMKDASLISGNFAGINYGTNQVMASVFRTAYNDSKTNTNGKIIAYSSGDKNYLGIISSSTDVIPNGVLSAMNALYPIDLYDLDLKIDDGVPNSGYVKAFDAATFQTFSDENNSCVMSSGSKLIYKVQADVTGCSASFLLQG